MTSIAAVTALLLSLAPWASERAAHQYAAAIVDAAGDDNRAALALAVTAARESRLSLAPCPRGPGGAGGWQLNPVLHPLTVACGPLAVQARRALAVLRRAGLGEAQFALVAGRYLGARARERHPEARRRAQLYVWAREVMACRCSLER